MQIGLPLPQYGFITNSDASFRSTLTRSFPHSLLRLPLFFNTSARLRFQWFAKPCHKKILSDLGRKQDSVLYRVNRPMSSTVSENDEGVIQDLLRPGQPDSHTVAVNSCGVFHIGR